MKEGAERCRLDTRNASHCTLLLLYPCAGAFPSAKGEGFEQGADWPEQRRGFRGNAENAKTKLCMRCALTKSPPCYPVQGFNYFPPPCAPSGGRMATAALEIDAILLMGKRSCADSQRGEMGMARVPDHTVERSSKEEAMMLLGRQDR